MSEDFKNASDLRYKKTSVVTIVGAVVNLVLAIIKIIVGKIAFSHALVVDGIHSLSDLFTDALVLYASKKGNQKPDEDHPYGHARIETFYTAVFGVILILVGVGIIIDAIERIGEGNETLIPTQLALVVAFISVVSKEILYQYTYHYAKLLHSQILKANAWHHRSDAVSSIVVLIGVLGSMYGFIYLDIVAAVIVAVMIAKIGWDLIYESANELVDKGLDEEHIKKIKYLIESIPDVVTMHSLRTRQMGSMALADVHIQVASHISVSEGHRISDEVQYRLVGEMDKISQVLVHIDPEDDEKVNVSHKLPMRPEVNNEISSLLEQIKKDSDAKDHAVIEQLLKIIKQNDTRQLILHYINGKIECQIFIPLDTEISKEEVAEVNKHLSKYQQHLPDYLISIQCGFN